MKKIKSNEFFKYFYGNLPIDTRYTIFAFQKGLQQNKNSGKVDSHCSVAFSFDHRICKIDRFLVNYGYPYEVEAENLNIDNILLFNHIKITNQHSPNKDSLNLIKDGKFSKNFFELFLIEHIFTKVLRREPNYRHKDVRAIAFLRDKDIERLNSLIEKDYKIYNPTNYGCVINIPKEYYSRNLERKINNFFPKNITVTPYDNSDLGEGLKYIKQQINGKTFKNNVTLERNISDVNSALLKQATKL